MRSPSAGTDFAPSVAVNVFSVIGPDRVLTVFGIRLLGFTATNGRKLLLTIAFVVAMRLIAAGLSRLVRLALRHREDVRARFLGRQAVHLVSTFLTLVLVVSIWFDNPARFAGIAAIVTAGLTIALQKVITSIAGYFVILRGNTFNIGDRITMGGVRGDVIALGYLRTTIMEMGEPPGEQKDAPSMWVHARQYTGRVVTVTNDKIFETPIYNYTRSFPYLFEEMRVPVKYGSRHDVAERIVLEAAERHSVRAALAEHELEEMARRYFVEKAEIRPRVYTMLTSNWIELSVRYVVPERGIREIKDAMSREILAGFEREKIEIASTTFEVVGVPELRVKNA